MRNGFAQGRLDALSGNAFGALGYKLQESLSMREMIIPTIEASRAATERQPLYKDGWDVRRGSSTGPNQVDYLYSINSFIKHYRQWDYSAEAVNDLTRLLAKAKEPFV